MTACSYRWPKVHEDDCGIAALRGDRDPCECFNCGARTPKS